MVLKTHRENYVSVGDVNYPTFAILAMMSVIPCGLFLLVHHVRTYLNVKPRMPAMQPKNYVYHLLLLPISARVTMTATMALSVNATSGQGTNIVLQIRLASSSMSHEVLSQKPAKLLFW